MDLSRLKFCVIIGAMKSGTTTLFQLLSEHPEIAASDKKELHFFSRTAHPSRNLEGYFQHWDIEPDWHRYCLEASPSYTKHPLDDVTKVASEMLSAGLEFRFIYIVRNPVERILSHLRHRAGHDLAINKDFLHLAKNISSYGTRLKKFLDGFPDAQIFVADFAALRENQNALLQEVHGFLEVPFHPVEPGPPRHINKSRIQVEVNDSTLINLKDQLHEDMLLFERLTSFDIAKWGF